MIPIRIRSSQIGMMLESSLGTSPSFELMVSCHGEHNAGTYKSQTSTDG